MYERYFINLLGSTGNIKYALARLSSPSPSLPNDVLPYEAGGIHFSPNSFWSEAWLKDKGVSLHDGTNVFKVVLTCQ